MMPRKARTTYRPPKRVDTRGPVSRERQRLKDSRQWRNDSKAQLNAQPLCEWCLDRGRPTPATLAHHLDNDIDAYWTSPLISLCKPCHSRHHATGHQKPPEAR